MKCTRSDPHERKSVYITSSAIAGAEEGVFARRTFLPGDLVAYFNGVRVLETQIYRENMTEGGRQLSQTDVYVDLTLGLSRTEADGEVLIGGVIRGRQVLLRSGPLLPSVLGRPPGHQHGHPAQVQESRQLQDHARAQGGIFTFWNYFVAIFS